MNAPVITVTDHAVIRWLERVRGVDVEAFRAEIVRTVEQAVAVGAHEYLLGPHCYVLHGTNVVTVKPRGKR